MKIIGVYKITNTITNDFYIGSSKNVKHRWKEHKCPSTWKRHPNNQMYLDFQKYGTDKFEFEILAEAEVEHLKEIEQQFIEKMQPTYNRNRAEDLNINKYKEYQKEYHNQTCYYNNETLTLNALIKRFYRAGIEHCVLETKKYLIK